MNNTLIIDLANDVFEIRIANAAGKIIERKRLTVLRSATCVVTNVHDMTGRTNRS